MSMKSGIILLLFAAVVTVNPLYSQKGGKKITITGFVVDANRDPVVNAIIMVDETKSNVTTSMKGAYKIKVSPDAQKIGIFTFENGVVEEMINERTLINFNFKTVVARRKPGQGNNRGEEEIDVGYGSVKRKNLTTSVSRIDGTNPKYASYNSIYDMIRGEVAGVQVQGTSIKIQGASSFMLSTEPLFVVDGVTVSSIADIRPQMVRSIEVLKGSSASIYGSRGANGVILINLVGAKNY